MNAIMLAVAALEGDLAVTDLVGNHIYLNESDQAKALPQLVLSDVSDTPINNLTGETALLNERIQIDIHSKKYSEAQTIFEAVKAAITSQADFSAVRQSTQKTKDLETNIHRWIVDFSIWYTTE